MRLNDRPVPTHRCHCHFKFSESPSESPSESLGHSSSFSFFSSGSSCSCQCLPTDTPLADERDADSESCAARPVAAGAASGPQGPPCQWLPSATSTHKSNLEG